MGAANRMDKQYPERIKDGPQTMLDKLNNTASGYGIVKFHKEQQKITFESWPIYDGMGTEISKYKTQKGGQSLFPWISNIIGSP